MMRAEVIIPLVMWSTLAALVVVVIPPFLSGTWRYVLRLGWSAVLKTQRARVPGTAVFDTEIVRRCAATALERWKNLWPDFWPNLLQSSFRSIGLPQVSECGTGKYLIEYGKQSAYRVTVLRGSGGEICIKVLRCDLNAVVVFPLLVGLAVGFATQSVVTVVIPLAGLVMAAVGAPAGQGRLVLEELIGESGRQREPGREA